MTKFSPATKCVLLCAAALLSACATPEGPRTVSVPVAVGCVPESAPTKPPVASVSQLAAMSDYELVLRIAAERLELISWVAQISPVIAACRE